MVFVIAKFIAGFFGLDVSKVQRWVIIAVVVIVAIALCAIGGFVFKACNRPPKLDEKAIQKAEKAIKDRNDAELKEILVESDVAEKQIDANVANAKAQTVNAINDSKKKYENMNTDDLAAEIERRKNQ